LADRRHKKELKVQYQIHHEFCIRIVTNVSVYLLLLGILQSGKLQQIGAKLSEQLNAKFSSF
jgi:hypothetical protein